MMKNIKNIIGIPKNYPGITEGTNEWYKEKVRRMGKANAGRKRVEV